MRVQAGARRVHGEVAVFTLCCALLHAQLRQEACCSLPDNPQPVQFKGRVHLSTRLPASYLGTLAWRSLLQEHCAVPCK